MNLLDVLKEAGTHPDGDVWFRPVDWKGQRVAFLIEDTHLYLVPSPTGGERYMITYTKEILGEWEIVTPQDVYEGK